jgi:hypothetical protein
VVHVLQSADDLHVLGAGQHGVSRLVDRLQAAAAQAIDGRPADAGGQPGDQADDARDVETLLALLLRIAKDHVLNRRGINACALDQRSNDRRGQVVRPHIAKHAALGMRPADRGATAINDNGSFHVVDTFPSGISIFVDFVPFVVPIQ